MVDGANKEQSLSSMIVSTAAEDEANRVSPHLVVVTSEASPVQCSLAASIQDQCMGLSIEVSIADTSSAQRTTDAVCVFLETMDGFDFQNPSEHVFESIKRVVRNNKKILWVSRRCDSNADRFEQDGVLGLARSILSENEDLKLITLGLETNDNEEIAQHVLKVVQQYFIPSSDDSQQKRCEGILEVAGSLCVGRLVPALQQQNDIQSILSEQEMRGEDAEESKEEFDPQVQKHQRLAFDKHATYLIVGGLGGLGRSMATWMISHGARNLILLSRKGGDNMAVKSYIDEAKSRGVTIYAPSCDIADEVALNKALQYATNYLPPIKGCIQAAMVLQSAMFQNLTLQQWIDTLRPKVAGSLNLHKHLPTDLDFFILLSSVCGIVGASGQSNYAFACTYQDILARHKASLGQKAISIDLGIVAGVGYTSERQSIGSFMHSLGMQYISEEYLHGLLEYYCNKNRVIDSAQEAQIVVGIMTEKKLRQKGLVKPRFYSRPLFSHLSSRTRSVPRQVMQTAETSSKAVTEQPSAPTPTRSLPQGETQAMISKAICNRLSETLALSIDDIEPSKPLHAYGVDSLVAMEMRNWFREALHVDMVVFDILSNISIDGLAGKVITSRVAAGTQ